MSTIDLDKKGGFTILELLLAIVILVVIMLYLSSLLHISHNTTSTIAKEAESKKFEARIFELIYVDILEAGDVLPTKGKNFDTLHIEDTRSFHNLKKAVVKWAVLKGEGDKNYLVRAESAKNFSFSDEHGFYLDKIAEVESFKVVSDREFIELYIKFKHKKPLHMKFFGGRV